jgi:pyruvate-ferredoxin/flavodoxin oxidoreductase
MVKGVFDELKKSAPKNQFTVGINDDVSHSSLAYEEHFSIESDDTVRCVSSSD